MSVETKIYRFYGINTAVDLLRPGAKWEWTGGVGFTRWEDPRPQPTKEEVALFLPVRRLCMLVGLWLERVQDPKS